MAGLFETEAFILLFAVLYVMSGFATLTPPATMWGEDGCWATVYDR